MKILFQDYRLVQNCRNKNKKLFLYPIFTIMENYKTLGQMLQEIVENEDKWYSLNHFLLSSTDEDRKLVESKLAESDQKQFHEFMD